MMTATRFPGSRPTRFPHCNLKEVPAVLFAFPSEADLVTSPVQLILWGVREGKDKGAAAMGKCLRGQPELSLLGNEGSSVGLGAEVWIYHLSVCQWLRAAASRGTAGWSYWLAEQACSTRNSPQVDLQVFAGSSLIQVECITKGEGGDMDSVCYSGHFTSSSKSVSGSLTPSG